MPTSNVSTATGPRAPGPALHSESVPASPRASTHGAPSPGVELPNSCCSQERLQPSPQPQLTAPVPGGQLARLGDMPQYLHPFVEGCTCGSGVMGCCPCTLGLAEHGAAAAGQQGTGALHGPIMAATGALGLAGLYLGWRAVTTNWEAGARLQRAQAHNDGRLLALQAWQQRLASDGTGASERVLAGQINAATRRQTILSQSLAERRFNLWVPGAVQLAGAALMVLTCAQHLFGLFAGGPAFGALATGVLAGYAALFAGRAGGRAAEAWRRYAAARAAAGRDPSDGFRRQVADEARRVRAERALFGLAWGALAATSIAGVVLPLLGCAVATALPWATVATQLAAVVASLAWSAPVHTPSTPRLDEAFEAGALSDLGLRQAWLGACNDQIDLVRGLSARLLQDPQAQLRSRHWQARLEPWTTPQCGPRAYAAVASAFVDSCSATGAWPAGTQAAVVAFLRHEQRWLHAAHRAQRAHVQALAPQAAAAAAEPGEQAYRARAAQAMGAEINDSAERLQGRLSLVTELADRWHALADPATQPSAVAERADLMVATLAALGLLGEVAGPWLTRRPEWFYAAPTPQRLAFGHVVLRPEHAAAFAEAVADTLAFSFVRCLFNPNRLLAERAELLAAGASFAPEQGPQPATSKAALLGAVGCSSCAS